MGNDNESWLAKDDNVRERVWQVENGRVTAAFAIASDGGLRLQSLASTDGAIHVHGADRSVVPVVGDRPFQVRDGDIRRSAGGTELVVRMESDAGDALEVHVLLRDDQSLFRQWLEFTPGSARTFPAPPAAALSVMATTTPALHTVSGVLQQGGWKPAEGVYRSFRLEEHVLSEPVHLESGPRSTWWESPWSVLDWGTGGGLLAISEYGGQWTLDAAHDPASSTTSLHFTPVGIVHEAVGGTLIRTPSVLYGPFVGNLDDAAASTHAYVRDAIRPAVPADFPWVQYNTWFSWFCELDEETLLREADIAAELGVELFYVDAGWWVGNPVHKDRFSSGLGNWTENRDKFPSGLRAFADGIRQRGMHFGIWVEPERVDLRTASTGTWRPEWLVMNGGRYAGPDWPSDTDTAWLCYGHRPTIEWAKGWIGDLVQSLNVRWLKWDSNYWQVCTNPEHDHGTGDGESAQLAGVYEVMAELRQRFPDLIIENCAGGGTRMDYALASETHTAWLNDATEPMHRSRFHSAGAAYLFPPEMNNAWVSESDYEKIGGLALTEPVIRASVRSRMLGALGFSCRLIEWTPNERRIVHEEIARYRRAIRPIMATGRFSHLLPQPEIDSATMSTPLVWEAYGITSSDRSRAVVLAFRNKATASTPPLQLLGLDPDATYDITYEDGQVRSATGSVIASDGITAECLPLESVVVEFSRHE